MTYREILNNMDEYLLLLEDISLSDLMVKIGTAPKPPMYMDELIIDDTSEEVRKDIDSLMYQSDDDDLDAAKAEAARAKAALDRIKSRDIIWKRRIELLKLRK